ncbi:MAG: hypothetical protein R3B83_02600 [Nitrospirales bacterium]|nr:hypothetical protein [Nitrospirales bacterium]
MLLPPWPTLELGVSRCPQGRTGCWNGGSSEFAQLWFVIRLRSSANHIRPIYPLMNSTIYQVRRDNVGQALWGGYLLALLALALVGSYLFAPDVISPGLAILGVVFLGICAFLSLRVGYSPEVYSIEISHAGVRRISEGKWIPWSDIVLLRDRPILNRVDLISPGGPTGISLEYQLEGFHKALDHVLQRVRIDLPPGSLGFRSPIVLWGQLFMLLTTIVFVGLGVLGWIYGGEWAVAIFFFVITAFLVYDGFQQISKVTISDEILTIRKGFRSMRYPTSDIASANLALRSRGAGHQYLDVFIEVHGECMPIRPEGSDPFRLFTALQSVIRRGVEPPIP